MPHPVTTKNNGKVVFEKYYIGLGDPKNGIPGGKIGILQTGAWVYFPSAQPIPSVEAGVAILESINQQAVNDFKRWWETRDLEPAAREILISPDGRLLYSDTRKEVDQIADIYAYYPPDSPVLETALRLFRLGEELRQELALATATAPFGMDEEKAADLGNQILERAKQRRSATRSRTAPKKK